MSGNLVTLYKRATNLMEAEIGEELVALDPVRGECFGFNSVATSVWQKLEEPKSFEQLRDALLDEFDVGLEECNRDLRELLESLMAKGLLNSAEPEA